MTRVVVRPQRVGFFLTAGFLGMMYYFCRSRRTGPSGRTASRSSISGP
jgi:hypothetical protein